MAKDKKRTGHNKAKKSGPPAKGPLPVTLLSGFLGAGKTTLLQHVLQAEHGLRIAVVVNDIGAVNVDANLISSHNITKTEEKVISMQNGCICCTLRGDLLEELVKLAKMKKFDYIIIESSGISEPEQVAETFDVRLGEQMSLQAFEGAMDESTVATLKEIQHAGGLEKFAKLDTAVTVIDAFTMLHDFDTAELISARRDDVTPEDERTVSDLMVDQIEFANIIVLNKLDMVSKEKKADLLKVIVSLNPKAKIIETVKGKVDPAAIVNTGLFNIDEAKTGAGWLQDLHNMTAREINGRKVITPKPETEEYNVRNFVYDRRRPFHPQRLWQLLYDKFILQLEHDDEEEDEDEDEDEDEGNDHEGRSEDINNGDATTRDNSLEDAVMDGSDSEGGSNKGSTKVSESTAPSTPDVSDAKDEPQYCTPEPAIILENKRSHPIFKDLLRSKGGFWMASRPDFRGEWSQAGAMLRMTGDMPFFCVMDPEDYEGEDGEVNDIVKHDIESGGEWGDRRQELVFIGLSLHREKIAALLDECLLNDEEWQEWQRIMRDDLTEEEKFNTLNDKFEDYWPEWSAEGHDHDHDHDQEDDDDEWEDEDEKMEGQSAQKKARKISHFAQELEEVS